MRSGANVSNFQIAKVPALSNKKTRKKVWGVIFETTAQNFFQTKTFLMLKLHENSKRNNVPKGIWLGSKLKYLNIILVTSQQHTVILSDRTFNPTTRREWMFYQKNMTVCYCHVMYTFQSESTLYNCLNARELLAWNKCDIWSLSDSKGIWTHNHLVHKRTLNHLAKLVIWLNGWVFVYELSGCRFESRCCQKTIIWNPFSAFLWKKYHYSIIVKIKFVLWWLRGVFNRHHRIFSVMIVVRLME